MSKTQVYINRLGNSIAEPGLFAELDKYHSNYNNLIAGALKAGRAFSEIRREIYVAYMKYQFHLRDKDARKLVKRWERHTL